MLITKLIMHVTFILADIIDKVSLLGSDSGQVLVLVNSLLVCQLTMDNDFDRIVLHDCMVLEMSFDPYEDENLPQRAGLPVCFVFKSPLLFAMTLDGIVCILYRLINDISLCRVSIPISIMHIGGPLCRCIPVDSGGYIQLSRGMHIHAGHK